MEPVQLAFGGAKRDVDRLPIDIADIAQAAQERSGIGIGPRIAVDEYAEARSTPARLLCDERPDAQERVRGGAGETLQECASPHDPAPRL